MTKPEISEQSQQLAQALLLEQVRFYRHRLTHELDAAFFQQFLQLFMQHAPNIQLKEVVELAQLQAVVKRYAFEMQLGAGLLEFIGEIAQRLHVFSTQSTAPLHNVFSDQQFEIWLAKFLELDNIRHYVNQFLKDSPSIQQMCLYIATTTLHNKLPKFITQTDETAIGHSKYQWQQKLKTFSQQQQQRLEHKIEEHLARFIQTQLVDLSLVSNDDLENFLRNLWDDHKEKPLAQYMNQLTPLDVEEFFVMLYEYWKELRQSSLIQDLILYGVKVFYDFYQNESLADLFAAIGIEQSDLVTEALRFYPKTIQALDQHGILEPILQMLLAPFYNSPATLHVIQQHVTK